MNSTIQFYQENAADLASRYEAVDFSGYVRKTLGYIPAGGRVLDIASGSGRDAAAMLDAGFDVVAADVSRAMLVQAVRLHPELEGRTRLAELSERLPFDDNDFDAVTSWATLMHLPLKRLPGVFAEFGRITRMSGILAYSVNTARPGLDEAGIDDRGRLFTCLSSQEWERLHVTTGFETLETEETDDVTGRSGVRWVTFHTRRKSR